MKEDPNSSLLKLPQKQGSVEEVLAYIIDQTAKNTAGLAKLQQEADILRRYAKHTQTGDELVAKTFLEFAEKITGINNRLDAIESGLKKE
jgi:cation transport regulator ChaC